eukprot:TRINITY_DN2298_c0_g1_i1.p2 TRINITY_DN2298_c0_g1~~TRINITY_DN2298_c0_g1_i1.p2  ORF type:complete len:278 (+),score=117.72 TRINITY_DN2298_c0_g1_i1:226-1059(+)
MAAAPQPEQQFETASQEGSAQGSATGSASPSKSLNAKRLRMAAENDVQFLANRIAKLRAEEAKAQKEIDKTLRKTKEILGNRKNFESKAIDKLQIREQIAASKKEERVLVSLNKDKQLKAIWVARQRLMNEKKEACSTMRKQKEINECRIHIMREEERDKNIRRKEEHKHQQMYLRVKREKELEERAKETRDEYEARIKREEEEREAKERIAAALVQQEAQLIFKLKQLHSDKQKAIRALAAAVDCIKAEEIEEQIEGEAGETEAEGEVPEEASASR